MSTVVHLGGIGLLARLLQEVNMLKLPIVAIFDRCKTPV